jgi:hypothetical protein
MKGIILKYLFKILGLSDKNNLRVIIFHDIEKKDFQKFEKLLDYLTKYFNIISPNEFKLYLSGKLKRKNFKNDVLLSFDDGYKSQKLITEKLLNPRNIKAIFFLISDFIKIDSKIDSQNFIRNNLYKKKFISKLDDDIQNMNYKDVQYLIKSGHTIGAHTKTHLQLSKIKKDSDLNTEICYCKSSLESLFKEIKIEDFAYTFGDFESINEKSLKIICENYRYIYSGLRGNNLNIKTRMIRRDAINLSESFEVISCYLSGYLDFLYKKKIYTLENWIK